MNLHEAGLKRAGFLRRRVPDNWSRASIEQQEGPNIWPRKIGSIRIDMTPGACCTGPMIELMSINKLGIKKIGARTEGPTAKTKKAMSGM